MFCSWPLSIGLKNYKIYNNHDVILHVIVRMVKVLPDDVIVRFLTAEFHQVWRDHYDDQHAHQHHGCQVPPPVVMGTLAVARRHPQGAVGVRPQSRHHFLQYLCVDLLFVCDGVCTLQTKNIYFIYILKKNIK